MRGRLVWAVHSHLNIPRRRWRIAFLLGAGVLVNYFDRVNLSVAHAALITTFAISNMTFGYLSAAYNWTYTLCQLPIGVVLDRFGVRRVGRVGALLWSVASFAAAIAPNLGRLLRRTPAFGHRGSPHAFRRMQKLSATGFPPGSGVPLPLFSMARLNSRRQLAFRSLVILMLKVGWRWSFAATGLLSFLYFLLFWRVYRDPPTTPNSLRRSAITSWKRERGAGSARRNRVLRLPDTTAKSDRGNPRLRGL